MSWIEIRARYEAPPEDWSPAIEAFARHGLENTLLEENPPAIVACVPEVPSRSDALRAIESELVALGAAAVEASRYEEQNWEELWKQFFKPRRVGKRIVVRPTWEEYPASEGDVEIVLDPGQAFGTGDHPTTRMCLELLEGCPTGGADVVDVGCGSGILAIAAAKLGARVVVGTDVDQISVEVARENAERNVVRIEFHCGTGFQPVGAAAFQAAEEQGIDKRPGAYDIALSNIISAALIQIAADAAIFVRPGGYWIVSGILESNWADVLASAEAVGFSLEEKLEEDAWVGAKLRR